MTSSGPGYDVRSGGIGPADGQTNLERVDMLEQEMAFRSDEKKQTIKTQSSLEEACERINEASLNQRLKYLIFM